MRRLTKREMMIRRRAPVTLWLDRDVLAAFKATGAGWQTRIDEALKDWLRTHSPA